MDRAWIGLGPSLRRTTKPLEICVVGMDQGWIGDGSGMDRPRVLFVAHHETIGNMCGGDGSGMDRAWIGQGVSFGTPENHLKYRQLGSDWSGPPAGGPFPRLFRGVVA